MRHRVIVKNIAIPNDAMVLDTSCQDGGFLEVLLARNAEKNLQLFGVDISKDDIVTAQQRIPGGQFAITDHVTLPYPPKTFDVVITSMTLHHMTDPEKSLQEIGRVLKDDGILYLVDIIVRNKWLYRLLNYFQCPEPYHFEKFYSVDQVTEMVTKMGYMIEKTQHHRVLSLIIGLVPIVIFKLKKREGTF